MMMIGDDDDDDGYDDDDDDDKIYFKIFNYCIKIVRNYILTIDYVVSTHKYDL